MTITIIYHVSVEYSEELTDYLDAGGEELKRQWNFAVEAANKGNVGSGSNCYTALEEWADFHSSFAAERAEHALVVVGQQFLARSLREREERKDEPR